MYCSKYNNDITYFFTWGKPVLIDGKGAICKEDTDIGKENWTQEYTRLYFKDGITEIKKGFLESFRIIMLSVVVAIILMQRALPRKTVCCSSTRTSTAE